MFKRILACLLVLVTLVSYLPPKASAAETQPQIKNDVTMEGTNSFGTLLANTVQNDPQSQSEGENSRICDLQIEGTLATVEYTTDRAAKVVVAIYTEDGATMLGSGVTEVVPEDTQTVVEIQIASMPQYYSAAAYLLDAETNDPLSQVFRTQLYTKVVQDVKNSTVEDYDPERVLNLDDDNTTNFAVFGEDTILVQEGSPCQISGGDGVYTVTNADERFLAMKAGDSFAVPQNGRDILIVKAARVSVQGDTVTIYEDADADLSDVFEVIKIEATADKKDTTYDESTLDPDFKSISPEEFHAGQNEVETYANREEESTIEKEFKTDGERLNAALKLKVTFTIKVYTAGTYSYISYDLSMPVTGKVEVKIAGFEYEIPLGTLSMRFWGAFAVTLTPKFYLDASVTVQYTLELKTSFKQVYDSDVGEWQDMSSGPSLKSALEVEGKVFVGIGGDLAFSILHEKVASVAVELQAGGELTAKVKVNGLYSQSDSSIHNCDVCIDGELNGVVKVKLKSTVLTKEKVLWKYSWKAKISDFFYCADKQEAGFTKCPHRLYRVKLTTLDSEKNPLTNVSVWLYDKENNPIKFVTRRDEQGDFTEGEIQNTDETGKTVFYLPNGEYLLEAAKGDQRSMKEITVHNEPKELLIVLSVQSGEAAIQMAPKELTLEKNAQEQLKVTYGTTLDITNACVWSSSDPKVVTVEQGKVTAVGEGKATVTARYRRNGKQYSAECNITVNGAVIVSGKCGDNLYWTLRENDTLTISGSGEMYDYPQFEAPWASEWMRIRSVVIEPGATSIGFFAFADCINLTSVSIPSSVKTIGVCAFLNCSSLTNVTIPASVTGIDGGAFSSCRSLTNVTIPASVTGIGGGAFECCDSLGYFSVNEGNADYTVVDGVLFSKDHTTLVAYPAGKKSRAYEIPDGVTEIYDYVFSGCSNLASVTIPESVTWIGTGVFWDCSSLTSIMIPEAVTRIGDNPFADCSSLDNIFVNERNVSYSSTDGVLFDKEHTALVAYPVGKKSATYNIPEGVVSIFWYAFRGCTSLTSITIPEGVSSIGGMAFSYCPGLTSVTIPESLTSIDTAAFEGSWNLKDIYYSGSCDQWEEINIDSDNDVLFDATIHCSDGTIEQGVSTFAEQPDETTETVPTEETVPETTAETVPETIPETIPETTAETTPETTEPAAEPTQPQETAQSLSTITWFRVPKGAKMEDGAAVRLSAHTGKETVRNGVRSVAFVGLEPGEEYVLIVSLKPGSVQPEDLQYIEQSTADGNGSVSFTYTPRTEVSAITQLYGISAQRKITLDREYLTIPMGSLSEPIQATVDPEEWTDDLVWFSENEDVVTVDENGCVTPVSVGTGYVVAEVTHGKYTITARCRVDVTEKVANEEVLGVDLGTKKVTTELYSTDYAKIDILPRLKQNEIALFSFFSAMPADNGSAITGAYLEDETARQFFDLRVKDDRQLLLVPTQEALDNAKGVKSSYSSKIVVLVNGVEYHTEDAVTISVKKTMPKLKAANLTFNPFYTEESQTLTITGGTVTKVEGTTPDWLTMDGTKLTLSNAPKSGRASLNLLVYTTEWAIPVNVKASVKLSYKAPGLKLSASSVTLSETDSLGVTLKLTAGKQSLEELNVKSVTLPAGFEDTELNLYTGEIALVPIGEIPTGKQAVRVSFYGTDSVLDLPLRVNKRTPTLRLSKTSVSLNAELGDSMTLKVTATPADLDLAKVTVTNPSEALEVSPVNENGEFTVTVKQGSASKASYALMVQAPTGKAAKLTVKTLAAGQKVTMSLKAAGSIDLTFPEKGVALQPKYRNYAGELENVVYTLALKQGKVTLDAAFDDYLTVGEDGLIRWNGTGSLESGNVCLITMTGELPNGTMLFATAQVRVTQTPVILRLSKASLSLNKRLEEKTQVTVTTSTRGYTLGDVELLVTDNKNVPSDGLTAAYENGLLTLSVNEKTVYGGSYKVQLWVTPKRVTTLMVRIPAEKNSAVTMTARARGGIDVIRDASEVVVTPIYRNCLDGASLKKQVKVTWAQDGRNYSQDVTEDFILTWAQDGTLHVSKVPGKELALTGKYRLEILCEGMEKEAYTALSVKCGTARFTVASVSLYAKDANDMARLTITTTDKTVNTLERVELKDARLKGTYEVLDLGGGQFALCLIPGAKAKSGTVTLNLFCEGNTTAKPSGTVSVKVEIR